MAPVSAGEGMLRRPPKARDRSKFSRHIKESSEDKNAIMNMRSLLGNITMTRSGSLIVFVCLSSLVLWPLHLCNYVGCPEWCPAGAGWHKAAGLENRERSRSLGWASASRGYSWICGNITKPDRSLKKTVGISLNFRYRLNNSIATMKLTVQIWRSLLDHETFFGSRSSFITQM